MNRKQAGPRATPIAASPSANPKPDHTQSVRLLKPADVAALLAIGLRKVWQLTICGELKSVRIGRSVRYDPRDVAAFVEARRGKRGPQR